MADIALRFDRDMLVLSSPIRGALDKLGIDTERNFELTLLLEPEVIEEAYQVQAISGAQCLVAPTATLLQARLARQSMEQSLEALIESALHMVQAQRPQHLLVELGSCGLPLDPSSRFSLREYSDQYVRVARLYREHDIDGYLLSGFESLETLKCAVIGLRKVSSLPIFAELDIDDEGCLWDGKISLSEVCDDLAANEVSVIGVRTALGSEKIAELLAEIKSSCGLPLLVELLVKDVDPKNPHPTPDNPYANADTMIEAADRLREAGAQFLRAGGEAPLAYTGALVAACFGQRVTGTSGQGFSGEKDDSEEEEDQAPSVYASMDEAQLSELGRQLRERIDAALAFRGAMDNESDRAKGTDANES